MSRPPIIKFTQEQVDAWNKKFPPGSAGMLLKDTGLRVHVITSSPAWLICRDPQAGGRGLALVKLSGFAGGWNLSRVTMLPTTPAETYDAIALGAMITRLFEAREECLRANLLNSAAAISAAVPMLQHYRDLRAAQSAPRTVAAAG